MSESENTETSQRIRDLESSLVALLAQVQRENGSEPEKTVTEKALETALVNALQQHGEITALLADPTINDILINGAKNIYVERHGKLERVNIALPSETEVFTLAEAIAAQSNRYINKRRPLLDARLADGSRVNIISPPLAIDGTAISIRKFATHSITLDAMAEQENVSPQLAEFLKVAGKCRLNVIISGGTGSGKTTLLNAISQHIDEDERVITIEDAAELRLQQPHVVRLETRPHNGVHISVEDSVNIRDLVRNALRMRPDRIIVGECRGPEAFDMMQAMNTGHEGSLTTVHANHPRDALARLENMVTMANLNLPTQATRSQIASAVHLIVQVSRMRDGKRRVTYVSEVVGTEGEVISMQDLFIYQTKGETPEGKLIGEFKWTGIMPRFIRRVAYYGEGERLSRALGVKLPNF
jgi:pilus assembly protein CpaF